jgi:class 3 adenylate cyclase
MLISQIAVSLENATLYKSEFELSQAYQRFVPRDFINALGKQSILQVKLGDNIDQDMTVMFCDIRSYSRLSETLTPQENFKLINDYLTRIGPVIRKNNGFINHYLGDGFIALFKDDPGHALSAATEINEQIAEYNQQRIKEGDQIIAVGIGLHTGRVMMGIIGDLERHDANVISDAVNVSSRLEGLTKIFGAGIVLSDATLNRIKDKETLPIRYLGKIKVKGKENIIHVYEMFDADETELRELKLKTLDYYNNGLKDYFNQNFAEAAVSLKKVLNENPKDKTARRYLQQSAKYLVEGVPAAWDGVEEMNEK